MDDFLKFASALNPLVTWTLVIVGWYLVSKQNDRREARKEIRATIDFVTTLIYDTHTKSVEFYLKPGSDSSCTPLRAQILRDLGRIGMTISTFEISNHYQPLHGKVADLRKTITLHEFDQTDRDAKSYSDQRITEITLAAKELAELLEARFREKYVDAVRL